MSFLVQSERCHACTVLFCAKPCPANCFARSGDGKAFIHADRCIDCAKCVSACPFDAIICEDEWALEKQNS